MVTELLNCPFCGGPARYLPLKIGFWREAVICDGCEFKLRPEQWNRRATPHAPASAPAQQGDEQAAVPNPHRLVPVGAGDKEGAR